MIGQIVATLNDIANRVFSLLWGLAWDVTSSYSIWMLGTAFLISALWYRYSGRHVRSWRVLWRALFPRNYLTNRSSRADAITTVSGFIIIASSIVATTLGLAMLPLKLRNALAAQSGVETLLHVPPLTAQIAATVLAFLGYEAAYWTHHWLMHRIAFLWHFHKVHHSAETLSPLTNIRMHPIDICLFFAANGAGMAAGLGFSFWLFGLQSGPLMLFGVNPLLLIAGYLIVTLQHSQVWIPLRGWAGHLILSPAHHQLHHAVDAAHHNSNYGSVLAIFDWAAGTLNIPPKVTPRLSFGVTGIAYDPHSLYGLFIAPIRDAFAETLPAPSPAARQNKKQSV